MGGGVAGGVVSLWQSVPGARYEAEELRDGVEEIEDLGEEEEKEGLAEVP